MPKKQLNITVLMPVYNGAKHIRSSIKSILNQTYKDFEFLIIDDGSTDNTEEIVHGFNDPRIIYKKTEHKGTSSAMNYGISTSSGNWIARIDSDDLNIPARLEKQAEFISKYPSFDIISSWSIYFRTSGKILFFLKEPVDHEEIYNILNLHNPLNSSGVIYKKNIIKKAKYNEDFKRFEDFELFFRIRDEVRFHNIPEFLSYSRFKKSTAADGDKDAIFDVINDYALRHLINSTRKRDQFYWATTIAWQNFFYGDKKNSRSYFKRIPNIKNIAAYGATFLPEKLFSYTAENKINYRLSDLFKSKKIFARELGQLLSQ